MNKQEFNQLHRRTLAKLDFAYKVVEGAIRWSRSESWEHFTAKCTIVRFIKEGIPPNQIPEIFRQYRSLFTTPFLLLKHYAIKLKKWQTAKVYCEARFSKKLIADILAITIDGAYVIEIVETETDKSLKRKKRAYANMEIEMIEVRI